MTCIIIIIKLTLELTNYKTNNPIGRLTNVMQF